MTIGIDASRANLEHKTGTEWYSFYLIKNLALIDNKNEYRLYLNKPPRPEMLEIVKHNPNFSFKILNWPFYAFWTLGRLTLEMIFNRPDVLFVPAHGLPLFGPFKTVNTIHDIAFVRNSHLYRQAKIKFRFPCLRRVAVWIIRILTLGRYNPSTTDYLYWSTAFALKRAKKIIVVSNFTKSEIMELYPNTRQEKIMVIHNGFNDEAYRPLDDKHRSAGILERYGIEGRFFLYAGRLEKKKNIAALVEAFSAFVERRPGNQDKLVLVGDAGFGYDEVKYIIQEFDLENRVIMPGWVREEDLPYIFSAALAFVFSSKYEGFGIPVLQAMACAVPTAVSNIPVMKEVAGDASLYFDPGDKASIRDALISLSDDESLRHRLITSGLSRAQEFSWRKCASETLELLEKL